MWIDDVMSQWLPSPYPQYLLYIQYLQYLRISWLPGGARQWSGVPGLHRLGRKQAAIQQYRSDTLLIIMGCDNIQSIYYRDSSTYIF